MQVGENIINIIHTHRLLYTRSVSYNIRTGNLVYERIPY